MRRRCCVRGWTICTRVPCYRCRCRAHWIIERVLCAVCSVWVCVCLLACERREKQNKRARKREKALLNKKIYNCCLCVCSHESAAHFCTHNKKNTRHSQTCVRRCAPGCLKRTEPPARQSATTDIGIAVCAFYSYVCAFRFVCFLNRFRTLSYIASNSVCNPCNARVYTNRLHHPQFHPKKRREISVCLVCTHRNVFVIDDKDNDYDICHCATTNDRWPVQQQQRQ